MSIKLRLPKYDHRNTCAGYLHSLLHIMSLNIKEILMLISILGLINELIKFIEKVEWIFLNVQIILINEGFKKVIISKYFQCIWIENEKKGSKWWGCVEEKVKSIRLSVSVQNIKR